MRWTAAYIASIALVNYLFTVLPLYTLPSGDKWSLGSVIVGLVFVARDFAQREIGHHVWIAMLIGAILSYQMADPFVAAASLMAFAVSECVDWAVYSWTKRPLAQRIVLSSLISTPVDSAVFLQVIGHLSVTGLVIMVLSKMVAAIVVCELIRRREAAHAG